jgi:CRP-like cAMP-binding protein/Na+/melibiose symporter-like transporter
MTDSTQAQTVSAFAVFRNRNFSFLWIAQLVSTIGSSLTSLAASILVFRLTGSAMSVGLMLMATAAPSVLVGLIAGVYVDRYDRKKIMIISDLIRAVLVVIIPFLVPLNIAWLYIIVALSSAVGQFFDPALESVLPEVASDEDLAAANSLIAISSFGSTAVGFAASGLIAARFPIEWAFYLDGLTFLISSACIMFVGVASLEVDDRTTVKVVMRNLKAGGQFLLDTPILRSLLIISIPTVISIGLWNSLLLPFAIRVLGATEFEFGLQEGAASIGFVVGSLLMAQQAARLREGQWLTLGYVGMGLVGILYAFSTSIPIAIVLVTLMGFLNAPASIARRLVIQRNTPREVRGRVNSAFLVARSALFLVGMAAAGLADVFDIRALFLVSGALLLGSGLLALGMPGLGQPAPEWLRQVKLLRAAPSASSLSTSRAATSADMDLLAGHLPALVRLSAKERETFIAHARVSQAPEGTTILRYDEVGDEVYFVLSGRTAAGIATAEGDYRSLSNMNPGDFFGEIAALTGSPRTANVVATEQTTLFQVPADTLRNLMADPQLSHLFLTTMTERLARTHLSDLPRFTGVDQESLRALRMPQASPEMEAATENGAS